MNWREKLRSDVVNFAMAHPEITMKQIARETGFGTEIIRRWVRAANGKPRKQGRKPKRTRLGPPKAEA